MASTCPRTVTLTHALIEQGATNADGWTRAQLAALGVPWPPMKGWKSSLVGRVVTIQTLELFFALRNKKKKPRVSDSDDGAARLYQEQFSHLRSIKEEQHG